MTPPKTIDQVRDEAAYEIARKRPMLASETYFISGFDASTKYHEEKYQELLADARSLRNVCELFFKDDNSKIGTQLKYDLIDFDAKYGGKG